MNNTNNQQPLNLGNALEYLKQAAKVFTEKVKTEGAPILEAGRKTMGDIKEDAKQMYAQFLEEAAKLKRNYKSVDIATLTSAELIKLAKENIVPGSNQVVAYRVTKEVINDNIGNTWIKLIFPTKPQDCPTTVNRTFVYLAYAKDRAMLPAEQNTYVIISAMELADDVKSIFADSDLVILK